MPYKPLLEERTSDGRWVTNALPVREIWYRLLRWLGHFLHHRRLLRRVTGAPLNHESLKKLYMGSYVTKVGWLLGKTVEHPIVYRGDILNAYRSNRPVLLRIDSGCFTGSIFQDRSCDCHQQLLAAMNIIDKEPDPNTVGLVIHHLHHEGKGHGFTMKLASYRHGMYPVPSDLREFRSAVAILKDLGITRVILLTNNPDKISVLERNGIEVVDTRRIIIDDPNLRNFYEFKRDELGHDINLEGEQQ